MVTCAWQTLDTIVIMSSATVFLEFWKRRRAVLAYDWDLVDWEEEEVKYLLTVDGCEKVSLQ